MSQRKSSYPSAAASIVAASCALASPAFASSLGGPLNLADEGSFFVNGAAIQSAISGRIGADRSGARRPHHRQPDVRALPHPGRQNERPAIVMVHGSNHTGMTYETTPDGREGWATWFVRQGHPVYVVDQSGRGRSGFNPTPVNAVRDGGADPKALPTLFLGTHRARVGELPLRPEISDAVSRICSFRWKRWTSTSRSSCPTPKRRSKAAARTRSTRSPRCSTRSGRRWSSCTRSRASTASMSCASGRISCGR